MEDVHEPDRFGQPSRGVRLDLDIDQITEAHRERAIRLAPLCRRLLDAEHLADERTQHRGWTAELAAEHAPERASLLLAGRVVQHDTEPPPAVGHDRWGVDHQGKGQATDINAFDVAAVDVEGQHRLAPVVRGRCGQSRPRAWTNRVARAVLEVGTFKGPSHDTAPVHPRAHRLYTPRSRVLHGLSLTVGASWPKTAKRSVPGGRR